MDTRPTPSGMIAPFGPPATVVEAGCRFDQVSGDSAVDAEGTVHAFVAFLGGSCGEEPVIQYVTGRADRWTPTPTPYRGFVLAIVLDGGRPLVLYGDSGGLHVASQAADGHFTRGRLLARASSPEWQVGGGDLVARDSRWWAVWAERASLVEPFELFQASTMTSDGERRRERISSNLPHATHQAGPTLVLDPADPAAAALGWFVVHDDGAVVLRFARARVADARWRQQAWAPPRPDPDRQVGVPDLAAGDGELYAAFEDTGSVVLVRDPPADVAGVAFPTPGSNPRVARSAGRTFVAWTGRQDRGHEHVLLGASDGAAVEELDLTPTAGDQQLVGLVASGGKATVLGASLTTHRLWARSQT